MVLFTRKYLSELLHEAFDKKSGVCQLAVYETIQEIEKSDMYLKHNLRQLNESQLNQMLSIVNDKIVQRENTDCEDFIVIYDQFNPIAAIKKDRTDLLRKIMTRINQDSDVSYGDSFELKTRTVFESKQEILSLYALVENESDIDDLDIY